MRRETSITIEAPAQRVYDLISDVTRMGEWSPETYRAEWLDGATAPVVGARFKGWNKRGLLRWPTSPKVIAADPGKEFAFDTGDTTWRYSLAATGETTTVVESFEVMKYPSYLKLLFPLEKQAAKLEVGMQETLRRLKAAAEANPTG